MKVLFAHDHVFLRDELGHYYSYGQFPYEVWQRYLSAFDSVVVASRVRNMRDGAWKEKLNLASGPNVSFVAIQDIRILTKMLYRRAQVARILKNELTCVSALIARLPSEIGTLAIQLAERLGKPWAVEITGCAWDVLWHYGRITGKFYAPFDLLRTKILVRRAPFALYVTKEFLQGRYPCRGRTANCSNVMIPETNSQVLTRRQAAIEAGRLPLRIGLIGSLNAKYKGIETALQALKKARGYLPPYEFRILGDGDARPWQKLTGKIGLSGKTVFCGTLPSGPAVEQWLDQTDIYIQPSFAEGLPRALIEAMGRGCPALGSTAGGIPELLSRDCLHRPGDSDRLAQLLTQAANKKWQLEQARLNFQAARQYTRPVLDQVRQDFWQEFAGAVKSNGIQMNP
ncbi:MAG TPA: glycosyl transferase family 1 [Syntrophomonas sp.]|nr:glycosyl transferase family 1 [Syntrophomonas sp.]